MRKRIEYVGQRQYRMSGHVGCLWWRIYRANVFRSIFFNDLLVFFYYHRHQSAEAKVALLLLCLRKKIVANLF